MSQASEVRRLTDLLKRYPESLRQALFEDREASCERLRALKLDADGWTAWNAAIDAALEAVLNREEDPRRFTGDLS
ncbi:MAG: hypothetical protein OEM93_10480 [Rhodospirillales bacterium]|nr:hypothetical protein [Rhodospirillales bacterium]MDH3790930.1 hypothetical protein [Rhodospirillales bacterium]